MNTNETRRNRLGASYEGNHEVKTVNHSYTRLIKTLRILLPLIVVGIIGVLYISAEPKTPALPIEKIDNSIMPTQGTDAPVIEKNELIKPEFESRTKDGKNYRITAANATQELKHPDMILLDKPEGILETAPYPLKISARNGTYNQKTQFITLNKDIEISQQDTGTIKLKTLEADLSRGEMFSPHPITAEGSYGTLRAEAMRITNEGMTIILDGPATLTMTEGFGTWLD